MSYPVPEGSVFVDGELLPVARMTLDLSDPGVQSGLGVFETIAVREGIPVDLDEHLARLARSASALAVPFPAAPILERQSTRIAEEVEGGFGWLKIVLIRSGRSAVFGGPMDRAEEGRPASAIVLPWSRSLDDPLVGVKSLNYAAFALGLEEARRRGADEGLWRNTRGHLVEGCSSNVFVVRGRKVFTPSASDGILAGVTRAKAIAAVRAMGLILHEGKVRMKRLDEADEIFLTSSLRAVRPLVRVDGRPVGRGEPGPVTREVAERVAALRRRAEAPSP